MAYDGSIKIAVDLDEKQLKSALSGIGNTTSKALGIAAKSVAAVSAAVVAAGGFAIKAGIEFESAFTGVVKTVNATDEQLAKLQDDLRGMAQDMPTAAADLADIAASAGQLGIQTDNIAGFTKTIADLGVATNLTGEEAATTLARFANITGMAQQDFDRLGSTIVALGNNLATSEAEITEMAMRLAGAGTQVGMTEDQILSFAGALSSVGIEAEAGGTAFSTLMSNMQLAVETGNEDLTSFAQIAGMSASEFKKAFKQDAAGAIISFINGLGQAEEKGQSAIKMLSDMGITEVRMRDALLRASGASELFTNSLQIGSQAWEENTALTKEAEQRYKTLESQLGIFKNNITELGIVIYEEMQVPLTNAVKTGIENIKRLGNSIQNGELKPAIQSIGTLFANLTQSLVNLTTAVLPALINMLSFLGDNFYAITTAVTALVFSVQAYNTYVKLAALAQTAWNTAMTLNPIGIVIAAVTALAVGIGALCVAQASYMSQGEKLIQQEKEKRQAFIDETKAYEEAQLAQTEKISTDLLEIDYAQRLWNELQTLSDSEGRVTEANRARAQFILTELNTALGTEYSMNGNLIQSYQEMANSIDTVMAKKRAQIILSGLETVYKEDVTKAAQLEYDQRQKGIEISKLEESVAAKRAQWAKEEEELSKLNNLQYYEQNDLILQRIANLRASTDALEVSVSEEEGLLEEAQKSYEEYDGSIEQCYSRMNLYQEAYIAAEEGNYAKVSQLYGELNTTVSQSASEHELSVDQKIDNLQREYNETDKQLQNVKGLYEKNGTAFYKSQVESFQSYKDELAKEALELGVDLTDGYASGISSGEESVNKSSSGMTQSALDTIAQTQQSNSPAKKTMELGSYFSQGFAGGILNGRSSVINAAITTARAAVDAAKKELGIQSPSKVMRDEVGAMISLGVAEGIEENSEEATKAFQSMLDKLEYQRDFDIINEDQYYTELERLRDEYLTTGTKEWLDYTQKIYEYQTELAQEQEAAIQSTYESLVSSASEAIGEIVSAQQSLASKMKDYGGELYETYSYTFQSERGEQTFEHVRLTDLQGDIDALEQYSASLQAVKQRLKNAGFSDDDTGSFFSVLAGMSVEEGQTFAQALNEATDEEFSGFVADWLKKQSLSEELSKQIYNDEVAGAVDKLEQELQNAGLEVPEGFFDSGVTAAENFGIGFTEQLQTEMQKISDIVRSFTGSFHVELAAAGTAGGGAYTSSTTTKTYYLQSTNETVHQQLETIRQNDKLEELRNG